MIVIHHQPHSSSAFIIVLIHRCPHSSSASFIVGLILIHRRSHSSLASFIVGLIHRWPHSSSVSFSFIVGLIHSSTQLQSRLGSRLIQTRPNSIQFIVLMNFSYLGQRQWILGMIFPWQCHFK